MYLFAPREGQACQNLAGKDGDERDDEYKRVEHDDEAQKEVKSRCVA